jgi:predicted Zn-dependent peptidase
MSIERLEQVQLPYLSRSAWWATVSSGQQVFIIEKPGEVVHLHTVVRTGAVNETDENTGVSHFLEHLMFKGTERFPAGAFDRALEGIGGRVNAATSNDWTQYFITLPKGYEGEYYRIALDLHADMMLHAALPPEEIGPPFDPDNPQVTEKRERMVVLEEINMSRDNPWRRAVRQLNTLLFPTHPYRREVLGTREVIASIPVEAIHEYYRTWYQPANMVTVLCGDLPVEETIREVEREFHFHEVREIVHPVFTPEAPPEAPRIERLTMPLNVAYVLLGFIGPPSAELRTTIGLDMLSIILGEGLSSRMHQQLVEQLPDTPFFDAGSTHWTYRDNSNMLAYGVVRPDAAEQAFDLLRTEVQRLQHEPPTADELEKTVTRLEAQFAAQAETAAGLAFAIADSMARLNTPSNYTEYLPILHSITRDALAEYARRYLDVEHLCAVTAAPERG